MANDISTIAYAICNILDGLPKEKLTLKLNGVTYGKMIKRYPLKSKTQTLTHQEIVMYTLQLIEIYKHWIEYGHKDWLAKEISGIRFTIMFTRKGIEEPKLTLEEIYSKQKGEQ